MDLMRKREDELSNIYKYGGRGFFGAYLAGLAGFYFMRGRGAPYFRNVMKHGILCTGGTFSTAMLSEKLASELYYNRLLI